MKILFVNDTSHQLNWGCRATCASLKHMIEASGHQIAHSIRVTELGHPPQGAADRLKRRIERTALSRRLLENPWAGRHWLSVAMAGDAVPARFRDFDRFAERSRSHPIFLSSAGLGQDKEIVRTNLNRVIEECDAVLINGEGSLHGDRRIFSAIMFVAFLGARVYDKPVVIANHSLQVDSENTRAMVEAVYPRLADFIVREPVSLDNLRRIVPGVADDALAPDAAFRWKPAEREAFVGMCTRPDFFSITPDRCAPLDVSRPYVGLTLGSGFGSGRRAFDDTVGTVRRLAEALSSLGVQVLLLAHCSVEQRVFRAVAAESDFAVLALTSPVQQVVDVVGNAAAVVGGRWHTAILALTGGTPVVPFAANTSKMEGLKRLMELESPVFDPSRLHQDIDRIVDATKAALESGPALRARHRFRAAAFADQASRHVRWFARGE